MSPNTQANQSPKNVASAVAAVVPQGTLQRLKVSDIKPNPNNPRMLFDRLPLNDLKENIRQHGVLVPITVYEVKGQKKFAILDGERRYRCCLELEDEGLKITIPANIVDPPDKIAGILYMFSIHNFREQWELMPTALSLQIVMKELGDEDTSRLSKITGLSEPQIERCKLLLEFPKKYQDMSLEPDPAIRIPSNFWTEAYPVLNLAEKTIPTIAQKIGRDGITDQLVEKYRAKRIKSVIHFRRIIEAYDVTSEDKKEQKRVVDRLAEYITNVDLETRKAFDEFVVDSRRIQGSINACNDFVSLLKRSKLEHALEKDELIVALKRVKEYVEKLLQKLEGSDEPGIDKKNK
jgi:ParB/RepB/Spo0J family partition protein